MYDLVSGLCSSHTHTHTHTHTCTGAKIHQSGSKIRCIEQGGVSYTLQDDNTEIPTGIATCLEHAKLSLQKCRDVESAITNLEKQSSDESYFPVTICRRPQKDKSDFNSPTSKTRLTGEASRRLVNKDSPSTMSTVCQTSPSVLQHTDYTQVREYCPFYM